jgi:hypothetical protein
MEGDAGPGSPAPCQSFFFRRQLEVVRLHNPLLAAIDDWRAAQAGEPTRAEALRRLAERGLASETGGKPAAAPAKPVGASAKAPAPKKTRPRRS